MTDTHVPFRILFAVDGSEGSYSAIEWVAHHMKNMTYDAILLHVMRMSVDDALHNRYEELKRGADTLLDRADKILGKESTTMSAVGGASATIAQIAEEQHAHLIVMGDSGHASIGGLGSTAFDVLHHANVAVLIVPKDIKSEPSENLSGPHIVLAVDGTTTSDEATKWLNQLARRWSPKISLFCVTHDVIPSPAGSVEMGVPLAGMGQAVGGLPGGGVYWPPSDVASAGWEEAGKLAQEETDRTLMRARMLLPDCPPEREEIGKGAAAASILDYAETSGADLIVMGRRDHSMVGNIFNSVSYSVVRHAPVPVLVVSSESDEENS